MMLLPPFKIGSRVRVNLGEHAGEGGVVVSRKQNVAPDPVAEFGDAPTFPSSQTWSWTYHVKLDSGETAEFDDIELSGTEGSEREGEAV